MDNIVFTLSLHFLHFSIIEYGVTIDALKTISNPEIDGIFQEKSLTGQAIILKHHLEKWQPFACHLNDIEIQCLSKLILEDFELEEIVFDKLLRN